MYPLEPCRLNCEHLVIVARPVNIGEHSAKIACISVEFVSGLCSVKKFGVDGKKQWANDRSPGDPG